MYKILAIFTIIIFISACGGLKTKSQDNSSKDIIEDKSEVDSTLEESKKSSSASPNSSDAKDSDVTEENPLKEDTSSKDTGNNTTTEGDEVDWSPVICKESVNIQYSESGLPLLENNKGAAIALFLDFDGGTYRSSSGKETYYTGYNRNGSKETFDKEEQEDIITSWKYVSQYYSMFDVNVTTSDKVKKQSKAWAHILISEEVSGGRASTSSKAIGTYPYARAYVGSSTVRGSDKSRRIAHELGHNFTLHHSGVWEDGKFYKWEDWSGWDKEYGPIMGGGGKGKRNGWSLERHPGNQETLQDTMKIIKEKIIDLVGESTTGWSKDDFEDDSPAAMCKGDNNTVYRKGILNRPDDIDIFMLKWNGGKLNIESIYPGVSAALLKIEVLKNSKKVSVSSNLEPGIYELHVKSKGGYGEIGDYEIVASEIK